MDFFASFLLTGDLQEEKVLFSGATCNTLEISGCSQLSLSAFQAGGFLFFSRIPLEVTHVLTNSAAGGKSNLNYPSLNSA